jgi:hypothetical protein
MSTKQWKEANIEKLRAYRRQWYANNRERAKTKIVERKKAMRAWLLELKGTLSCSNVGCHENHPACLEFHHEDRTKKETSIAQVVALGWSKARILGEMAKCRVLCANCHRKAHWEADPALLGSAT